MDRQSESIKPRGAKRLGKYLVIIILSMMVFFSLYTLIHDAAYLFGNREEEISEAMSYTFDLATGFFPYIRLQGTEDSDLIDLYESSPQDGSSVTQNDQRLFQFYIDRAASIDTLSGSREIDSDQEWEKNFHAERRAMMIRALSELERDSQRYHLEVDYELQTSSGQKLEIGQQILASLIYSLRREEFFRPDKTSNVFIPDISVLIVQDKLFIGCEDENWKPVAWFFNTYVDLGWKCIIDAYKALDHDHLEAVLALP